jgi:hypothetical protein
VKNATILAALILGAAFIPSPARADNGLLSLGIGDTGIFKDSQNDAADFRVEYRDNNSLIWQIKPTVGAEFTTHGQVYGYGGLYWDWPVQPHWYVTPSFDAGLYHDGGGPDLGSVFEFRYQIEGSYEFESRDRVSLALSQTSNLGIDDRDPGTDALVLYYHMPLSRLTGSSSSSSGQ